MLTPPEPIHRCRQKPEQQQTQAKPKRSHQTISRRRHSSTAIATLTRLPQHLPAIVEIVVDVAHRVALKLRDGVFHLRETVTDAQTESVSRRWWKH